eukprot:COSAG04_NODE_7335_length_1145_cov_1.906310_1_plen_188_part_01
MVEPNHLNRVAGCVWGVAFLWALLPLESARVALQPKGFLSELGAGTTEISASAARSVARWRAVLSGFATMMTAFLLWAITLFTVFGKTPRAASEAASTEDARFLWAFMMLTIMVSIHILFAGWWASMMLGSTLARDASVEVIAKVQTTNPKDAEAWSKDVEQPALDLDRAFKALSAGWGLGLLGTTLC